MVNSLLEPRGVSACAPVQLLGAGRRCMYGDEHGVPRVYRVDGRHITLYIHHGRVGGCTRTLLPAHLPTRVYLSDMPPSLLPTVRLMSERDLKPGYNRHNPGITLKGGSGPWGSVAPLLASQGGLFAPRCASQGGLFAPRCASLGGSLRLPTHPGIYASPTTLPTLVYMPPPPPMVGICLPASHGGYMPLLPPWVYTPPYHTRVYHHPGYTTLCTRHADTAVHGPSAGRGRCPGLSPEILPGRRVFSAFGSRKVLCTDEDARARRAHLPAPIG